MTTTATIAPPVTPVHATPGMAFQETVSDCVSAILVARGVATTNLRLDDPLELEVEITAEDPDDPALQILITAESLSTDPDMPDPDIQGMSRPSAQNAAMLSLTSESLLLLYRALGQAIGMAVRSGMVRLPTDDSGLACELPDPWRELRAVSPGAATAHALVESGHREPG
jgi:hypothetical protein